MITSLSDSRIPTLTDPNEMLLGIFTLAIVDALWQRDSLISLGSMSRQNVFAVDTDVVIFFTQPAFKTQYLQLPGLLPLSGVAGSGCAPTKKIAAPEVLAQIMGHYIFQGSDHLGPKLMFPSTQREIERVFTSIKDKAFKEINATHQKLISAQKTWNRLVAEYFRDKSNASPQGFVEHFLGELNTLYPAIFSDGTVREFKRFGDLLNSDEEYLLSPHQLVELDQALNALQAEQHSFKAEKKKDERPDIHPAHFNARELRDSQGTGTRSWSLIHKVWTWAINSTSSSSKSDVTNKDDIDALATIEWCNRWLESQRIEYRIIFVTGAASFYGAARIRWGFAESHHLSAHTLARLGQAAHPFAYYVDLLTAGQGGSAGELSAAERYTPLRDVRYFLADPAFLAYARRSSAEPTEIAKSMVGANLTEWLQAVLLRLNKEDRYIAWNFMELSGIRMSPQGVDWQPVTVTSVVKEDIEVFEKKWQGFLQQASFNHLIDRGIRRRSLKLLVECFASYDKNEDDTYRLLSDYLHEAHIDVSRAATNLSIVALASKTRQGDPAPMDRCVPPLVLHRFPHAQAFVSTLLQTLRSPLGAQIQEHLETLKSNCFGVDAKHLYTRKYLDLLLRAYCFAIFREWKGALFLAKEAYLVTQLQIHQRNRLAAEDELTGREAAYLACVASRHPENFDSLRKFDQRCIDWLQYLERSIDVEEKIGKLGRDVIELHRARFSSEELAHELMYRFYSKWGDRSQGSDPLTTEVIDDLDSSFAHLVNKIVKLRSDWETGSDNAAPDRQELRVAQLFVLRQALINLAQTRFLLAEDWQGLEQHMSNEQVATLLEDANRLCETQFATTLPESDLHGHITALARHFAGRLKVRELEQVQRSLKEKIDALKTCTWALAYDSHKYQAILACISAQ